MTLDEYKNRLSQFLERNPLSEIKEFDLGDKKHIAALKPWGDDSLIILLGEGEETYEALNAVYLPECLSAIWHADTEALEFIWTTLPTRVDARDRQFTFNFEGVSYGCRLALPVKDLP